jgi:hypothetical protein
MANVYEELMLWRICEGTMYVKYSTGDQTLFQKKPSSILG